MIPKTNEILAQLMLLWQIRDEVEPVEPVTLGALAHELMYPPLFIINAMDLGVSQGFLKHDYESDKMTVLKESSDTFMGNEVRDLMNSIEDKVRYENNREQDISLGLLQQWCVGVRPSAAELALRRLCLDGVLVEYTLTDPKDKKSSYQFYTLAGNESKQWGLKQFKSEKKGKK